MFKGKNQFKVEAIVMAIYFLIPFVLALVLVAVEFFAPQIFADIGRVTSPATQSK
jgi:TRAP-type mannitol/chloroaromatic compound transport system permease small subunit